jgi:hypothetical protein
MKPYLLLTAVFAVLAACNKQDPPPPADPNNVIGGILSARINGSRWEADNGYFERSDWDTTWLQLFAARNPNSAKLTDITLTITEYRGPGVYKVAKGTNTNTAVYSDNITPYNADTGTVTIVSLDSAYVRGSFSFEGLNNALPSLRITEGQFRLPVKQ